MRSPFCCFNDTELIFSRKSLLRCKNSVKLKAIQEVTQWATITNFSSFLINSDGLSSIIALEDLQTTNALISEILQNLKKQSKKAFLNWEKGYSGILGSELIDKLAKKAAQDESHSSVFLPFPNLDSKYELKRNLFTNWQRDKSQKMRSRFTYKFLKL